MNKIKVKGNKLFIFEKLVYTFLYGINNYLIYDNKIIVLLSVPDQVSYNENIFCFNLDGNLLWQVARANEHNKICPFTGISINNNKFTPYKSCGILCIVDVNTGKILSSEFIK